MPEKSSSTSFPITGAVLILTPSPGLILSLSEDDQDTTDKLPLFHHGRAGPAHPARRTSVRRMNHFFCLRNLSRFIQPADAD
jgi:hypothetical protein